MPFILIWIILFAHLIRESGNWGKLWEGSKFNLFKGDALCISGFFLFADLVMESTRPWNNRHGPMHVIIFKLTSFTK